MNGKFVRRSTGVRVLTLVLALVLVVGASVAGTLAWLTAETDEVVNTFTSAELFDATTGSFTLWEHRVADVDEDGQYEWAKVENDAFVKVEQTKADKVTENSYDILPGVDIPKDPTVDVVNLEEHAYLYIEVAGTLPDGLSYSIDTNNWQELTGYDGVYVFKGNYAKDKAVTNNVIPATDTSKVSFTANILAGNTITVFKEYNGTADTGLTLTFNAYMVQATGNGTSAAEAWGNTYGTSASIEQDFPLAPAD